MCSDDFLLTGPVFSSILLIMGSFFRGSASSTSFLGDTVVFGGLARECSFILSGVPDPPFGNSMASSDPSVRA